MLDLRFTKTVKIEAMIFRQSFLIAPAPNCLMVGYSFHCSRWVWFRRARWVAGNISGIFALDSRSGAKLRRGIASRWSDRAGLATKLQSLIFQSVSRWLTGRVGLQELVWSAVCRRKAAFLSACPIIARFATDSERARGRAAPVDSGQRSARRAEPPKGAAHFPHRSSRSRQMGFPQFFEKPAFGLGSELKIGKMGSGVRVSAAQAKSVISRRFLAKNGEIEFRVRGQDGLAFMKVDSSSTWINREVCNVK